MNIQHVFAENMKALRSERRYTQEELSQISGLHRTYIGGVEQERINVSLKNIGKIASALNTNPAFFFASLDSFDEDSSYERATSNDTTSCNVSDEEPIYSICIQKGTEVSFIPIEVESLDLSMQILCSLIQHEYSGKDLAHRYKQTKQELLEYFSCEMKNEKAK